MRVWVYKWIIISLLGFFTVSPKTVWGSEFKTISFDSSRIEKDSWFGQDKAKHLLASMLLTGSVAYVAYHQWEMPRAQSRIVGIGFAFSLGMIKECHDQRRVLGHFSWKDLSIDILGIGVGVLCFTWW